MTQIGRYKLGKTLGEGGMAVVYAATDTQLGRTVAIKLIQSQYATSRQYRAHFIKEARTLARLSDTATAVVPIYDFGEESGIPYLVMPFMEGGSLIDILQKRGVFSLPETIAFATPLASALDYFHQQGVIHRDLKPGNILYNRTGEPFISDFGIAKVQGEAIQSRYSFNNHFTPRYATPEQFDELPLTPSTDLYSFALILYEVLAGQPPFSATSNAGWMKQHLSQPVPDIRKFRPDLPLGVTAIFEKALAKKPSARYSSVEAFVVALARTATRPFVAATPTPRAPINRGKLGSAPRAFNGQRWLMLLLLGGVALILAVVAWSNSFQPNNSRDENSESGGITLTTPTSDLGTSAIEPTPEPDFVATVSAAQSATPVIPPTIAPISPTETPLFGMVIPSTHTGVPPTNTPQPIRPSSTPQPLYVLSQLLGGPDCAYTGISGTVFNRDGTRRGGITVDVFNESGFRVSPVTDDQGFYEAFLDSKPRSDLAGPWHIQVVESGVKNSNEIVIILTGSCTNPSDMTKVVADFYRTQ